jgi:Leucine-rich repeat (LRR) protein
MNKCTAQVPTDFYRPDNSSSDLYYKKIHVPDQVQLAGINLSSKDLFPLTICDPILKSLIIEDALKINDDTLINEVLVHQKKLEFLSFENTSLSDKTIFRVAKLNHLKKLCLLDAGFITWRSIYYLSQNEQILESLETLALRGYNIGRIGYRYDYTKKEYDKLESDYENLDGLAILGRFKNLRKLYIYDHGLSIVSGEIAERVISSLSNLSKLEILIISGKGINDTVINNHIEKFSGLNELDLSGTNITDESIKTILKLKQLEVLAIQDTHITSKGLEQLKSHPSLRSIIVTCSYVNEIFYNKYNLENREQEKPMPKLQVLNRIGVDTR